MAEPGRDAPARASDAASAQERRQAGGPVIEPQRAGPIIDIRVRWRAGQLALGLAVLLAVAALARPLGPSASPRLRLLVTLLLGLGVAGAALLASLRGRGRAEQLALYAFLVLSADGLGQVLAPLGWPIWPVMGLLLGALAVAERLPVALGAATLASVLAAADAARSSFTHWKPAAAAAFGYAALALAVNRALLSEKHRLSTTLAELARLKLGIDHLEDTDPAGATRATLTGLPLRQVSEESRRARQVERAEELEAALRRIVGVARSALSAHAVLYFDVDREREVALLRAAAAPESVVTESLVPLGQDPFAFVLDRREAFYVTDFKRLLWALPYYKAETRIGSLLAVPVKLADVVAGVLVADRVEVQSLAGREAELLESFAEMAAEAIHWARASLSREELGAEFKAVYAVSRTLAELTEAGAVHLKLVQSARDLVSLEGAAVVMADEERTRYVIETAHGWAKEFEGREVGLSERTWAAWVLRSAADPYLLDHVAGHDARMPILALDEGSGRAESLLAIPLKTGTRNVGALLLTGRRGAFDATALRVLGFLSNHAAAILSRIRAMEHVERLAARDGLTGLYNRRTFDDYLARTLAVEDRRGGRFAVLLLDLDHFKRLNDTYGHPAGDAALRNTARVLERHLRKGDQAARYGGEEFAVILPGADEVGALHLGERVRRAIEKDPLVFEGARISVTASLGAGVWPADGRDAATLLASTDRALYAAKEAGRNRVVAASALTPPPG